MSQKLADHAANDKNFVNASLEVKSLGFVIIIPRISLKLSQ
jgi:hypothetical protein